MKSQTFTTKDLADVLVSSYKLNSEEQHRQNCLAYKVLFDDDFYNEASNKAIQILSLSRMSKQD